MTKTSYRKTKTFLTRIFFIFSLPIFGFSGNNYAPIMMGDITIFVPYSKVSFSLGENRVLGENEHQLHPVVSNRSEVKSYLWLEEGNVLGKTERLSTVGMSVGTHTIVLRITDINGYVTEDEVTITIKEYQAGGDFVGSTKGSFSVAQGAASYNLKVMVPPGVAGMEPKLSLHYSSQNGNGYMGEGWNIEGVSNIVRCPQSKAVDGVNHAFGVHYNTKDRFCMDGQRLIHIRGSYGADGTEYRTEINNYSKVVSRGSYKGGPRYFDVYTKSGLHYIYGARSTSYENRSGTAMVSWKVDRIIDSYGNTIYFTYVKDTSKGIHYLSKVSYAGTSADDTKSNTIEYVYTNRRPDTMYRYRNGYKENIEQRLQSVIVKSAGKEIRRYEIQYEEDATGLHRSRVKNITESMPKGAKLRALSFSYSAKGKSSFSKGASWINSFGSNTWSADKYVRTMSDVNGDGLPDIVGFGNSAVSVALGTGKAFKSAQKWSSNFTYRNRWRVGKHQRLVTDVNGDGIPDLVGFADIGVHVGLGTGSGFETVKKWSNDFGSNVWESDKYVRAMADVNGDGLPDIVGFGWDAVWVALNKGKGFTAMTRWHSNFSYKGGWRVGRHIRLLRDINGDGLADIVGFAEKGVYVALATGKNFGATQKWSNDYGSSVWNKSTYIRTMSDVNGDGLPDIVGFGNKGVYVGINTGKGFKSSKMWSHDFGANKWDINKHIRMLSDVNGDGLDDIVGFGDTGVYVALSTGHGFEASHKWVDGFSYENYCWKIHKNQRLLPDVNGDGLPDVVGFGNTATNVGINNEKQVKLVRISNGVDQDIKIKYGNMIANSALYYNYTQHGKRNAYAWNQIANDNMELSLPISLVSSVSQIDGVGGYNTQRYKYFGYIANKLRGLQGFHAIHTYDYTHQTNSGVIYKQIEQPYGKGFAYTGMPATSYEADTLVPSMDKLFSKIDITYKDASTIAKVYEPYTYSNRKSTYDPSSKTLIKVQNETNTMSHDGLGNILSKVTQIEDKVNAKTFKKTIKNEYKAEDVEVWHIGRLSKSTVTHTQTDGDTVVRASTFAYNSHGLLQEEVANAGTSMALKKSYTYTSHGNKKTQTLSGTKIGTSTLTYGYSQDEKFQTSIKNAVGLEIKKQYNADYGTLASMTNEAGVTTSWEYDALGRKTKEIRADGTYTLWRHQWYEGGSINQPYVYSLKTLRSGFPVHEVYYDSFGRERYAYTFALGGKRLNQMMHYYNKKGELFKEVLPYLAGDTPSYLTRTYDAYGRVIGISKPGADGEEQTVSNHYSNFTLISTNSNSHGKVLKKRVNKNAMGQVLSSTDAYDSANASQMTYTYDALGQLKTTTDAKGNKIVIRYDAQGNKTYLNDPDLGVWNYRYREDGKLDMQWSGTQSYTHSKHVTQMTYDIIGRVTMKNVYDATQSTSNHTYNKDTFSYDSHTGRASKHTFVSKQKDGLVHGGYTLPKYDSLGRVIETKKHIYDKGDFVSKVSYDAYSRPLTLTYPNGYSVTNHYSDGLLDQVKGSDGKVHYTINKLTALGQIASGTFGNGIHTLVDYNQAGAIEHMNAYGVPFGNIESIDYSYDAMGNVLTRKASNINGHSIEEVFRYDAMQRLVGFDVTTDIKAKSFAMTKRYAYDSIGNMTFQTGIGDYHYDSAKPHALTSAGSRTYVYDHGIEGVGNMTNRNGDHISYNAMNKPSVLQGKNGKTVKFYYDTSGQRYQKEAEGIRTYYIGKSYEEQVEDNRHKQICYITIAGKTVGEHVEVLDTDYVTSNPHYHEATYNRYFHTDALGSITAITDDAGKVVERRSYEPFGKIRAMDYGLSANHAIIPTNTVVQTTRAYTGHEQIAEIDGLIHMNARVYDSDIGRFLSADTVIQDPLDSQAYNRYSYVRNNPMKFTDPTGHSWLSKAWHKIVHWVDKHIVHSTVGRYIVGAFMIIGGVALAPITGGASLGAALQGAGSLALISGGGSLINYDPNQPQSSSNQISFTTTVNIPLGGSTSTSEAEQVEHLQEQSATIDRTNAGVATTSASPVTNDNYASGAASGSYANTVTSTTTYSNGEYTLAPITVTATSFPKGYEWIGDLPDYAYTAFTYTNIGGVVDVGYQYYNGEIGGWYAAGMLGASALGGKVGGKAYTSLTKYYASLEQIGSEGMRIAGLGTSTSFRNASHYADRYGGNSEDWVKMSSKPYIANDGVMFETHWVENIITGQRVNHKTKFPKGL